MRQTRFESVGDPFVSHGSTVVKAARLIARGDVMGFVDTGTPHVVLDGALVRAALSGLAARGVATHALLSSSDEQLTQAIDDALESSEHSPMPAGEWPSLAQTIGEELLTQLLDISPTSLRRYATGSRPTPTEVAERLHVLALIVADLAGAYNEFGIRRWFTRPRSQLDDASPATVLGGKWDPEGANALRLRGLAASLVGAGGT
jgi:hypothetical protein